MEVNEIEVNRVYFRRMSEDTHFGGEDGDGLLSGNMCVRLVTRMQGSRVYGKTFHVDTFRSGTFVADLSTFARLSHYEVNWFKLPKAARTYFNGDNT